MLSKQQHEALQCLLQAFSNYGEASDKLNPKLEAGHPGGDDVMDASYDLGTTRITDADETAFSPISTPRHDRVTRLDRVVRLDRMMRSPLRSADGPPRDPGASRRATSVPSGRTLAAPLSWQHDARYGHPSTVPPQLQQPAKVTLHFEFEAPPEASRDGYRWNFTSSPRPAPWGEASSPPPAPWDQPFPPSPQPADSRRYPNLWWSSLRTSDPAPLNESVGWSAQPSDQLVKKALQVLARQAQIDARVEDAKALLPTSCSLEDIFSELDRTRAGQVSSTDLRLLAEDFGESLTFAAFRALVRELRLRRPFLDAIRSSERLSFRDVGVLTFNVGTKAYQVVRTAESDAEARTQLYLLKFTEQCPTCGVHVQRSAECAGCPSVTCILCRTPFRCYCVVGDQPADQPGRRLPTAARYQLQRLVREAARAAEELERDREQLSLLLAYQLCGLIDVFRCIAGSSRSFGLAELRRALLHHNLLLSEQELGLLWNRYVPSGEGLLSFPDFRRQLQTFL